MQSPVARTDLATCTGTITGTFNMYYSSTLRRSTYVLVVLTIDYLHDTSE